MAVMQTLGGERLGAAVGMAARMRVATANGEGAQSAAPFADGEAAAGVGEADSATAGRLSAPLIEVRDLSCGYGDRTVVQGFSETVCPSEVLCLLGPNGVGKTTLFKTMLGMLPAIGGEVLVRGRAIDSYSPRDLARVVAYVPQAHTPPFAFTAFDVVVMGAAASSGLFGTPGAAERDTAAHVLSDLGISKLSDQAYTELSGGQRQMVLIARAVAQGPKVLFMDEPTASLDLGNIARVLAAVNKLAAQGMAVVMTTHSPEHIAQCHARGVLIARDGRMHRGNAETLLTPELLSEAYGCDIAVGEIAPAAGEEPLVACQPVVD